MKRMPEIVPAQKENPEIPANYAYEALMVVACNQGNSEACRQIGEFCRGMTQEGVQKVLNAVRGYTTV